VDVTVLKKEGYAVRGLSFHQVSFRRLIQKHVHFHGWQIFGPELISFLTLGT